MESAAAVKARFRTIDPEEFVRSHFVADQHTDEPVRSLDSHRDVSLQMGVIANANGSAMLKQGNTTMVCGVKAELQQPIADAPDVGRIELRIDASNLNLPDHMLKQVAHVSAIMNDLLTDGHLLDLHRLCVIPQKLVWVLYCDMQCLMCDGALLDVCLLCALSALYNTTLHTVSLPQPVQTSSESSTTSTANNNVLERALTTLREKTSFANLPIEVDVDKSVHLCDHINVLHAVTFTFYKYTATDSSAKSEDYKLIVDPNAEELALYPATLMVVVGADEQLYGVHRLTWKGCGPLPLSVIRQCTSLAHERHTRVQALVKQAHTCATK